ncbi:hypothetical protein PanWU01x14_169610 [Parasponia andersonii]|uniref:Uncharacterized protein n=1 Tax=Parasponia andersonii TaxID=3476 RepID=A0A2P5CAE2_PARAD|nr:hypothetical protein PanWU01x14_169610 [Parasponia andersonii]
MELTLSGDNGIWSKKEEEKVITRERERKKKGRKWRASGPSPNFKIWAGSGFWAFRKFPVESGQI